MVKAVKALNSSASEGKENTIPLQKKKSSSSSNFTFPKCTLVVNTALQNFSVYKTTQINQGKTKILLPKKNRQKRNALFP